MIFFARKEGCNAQTKRLFSKQVLAVQFMFQSDNFQRPVRSSPLSRSRIQANVELSPVCSSKQRLLPRPFSEQQTACPATTARNGAPAPRIRPCCRLRIIWRLSWADPKTTPLCSRVRLGEEQNAPPFPFFMVNGSAWQTFRQPAYVWTQPRGNIFCARAFSWPGAQVLPLNASTPVFHL